MSLNFRNFIRWILRSVLASLAQQPLFSTPQVQPGKLQAGNILANYQCSPLPCEMWSVWDDNMAIHYSLELGAGCRSMGRTHQKPNTGYFLRSPGLQPTDWPTVSWHYSARDESSGKSCTGHGWVNDSKLIFFFSFFFWKRCLCVILLMIISVHHLWYHDYI